MFNIVDGEPFVKVINYPQNANKQNTKSFKFTKSVKQKLKISVYFFKYLRLFC